MNDIRMYGSGKMDGAIEHNRGFYGYNNGPAVNPHRPWWYVQRTFDPAWFDGETSDRANNLEAYKLASWLVQHTSRAGGYNSGSQGETRIVGWQIRPESDGGSGETKFSWRYSPFNSGADNERLAYRYWINEARKMLNSGVPGCELIAVEIAGQRYAV